MSETEKQMKEYLAKQQVFPSLDAAMEEIRRRRQKDNMLYKPFLVPDTEPKQYWILDYTYWEKMIRMGYQTVKQPWF